MKIFLAGRTSRRTELAWHAQELARLGHEIVSRWLDTSWRFEPGRPASAAQAALISRASLDDVVACDLLIAFTEPAGSRHAGGGRHCETGAALALDKRVWILGEQENVFHGNAAVRQFDSWGRLLEALDDLDPHASRGRPRWREGAERPSCDTHAETFWEQHARAALTLAEHLEKRVPGLVESLRVFLASRDGIYRAVLAAWRRAGRPAHVLNGVITDPDLLAGVEAEAVSHWFQECVRHAAIDHDLYRLEASRHRVSPGATPGPAAQAGDWTRAGRRKRRRRSPPAGSAPAAPGLHWDGPGGNPTTPPAEEDG